MFCSALIVQLVFCIEPKYFFFRLLVVEQVLKVPGVKVLAHQEEGVKGQEEGKVTKASMLAKKEDLTFTSAIQSQSE